MKELKIYEIAINGEKEWVAAYSLIGALQFYCTLTDIALNEFEDDDNISELPKDKWSEYTVNNADIKLRQTFSEAIAKLTSPDIIAGTMYE